MFTKTEAQSRRFEQTCRRRRSGVRASLTLAGLVALAAGLVVAAPAQAGIPYATTFTHSAKSGQLKGGRLTLRGVAGRVTYVTNAGRSGRVSVRRLHRRVIVPGRPATGTLHVAGHRGGDEPTFRLSRPRYNAARRTVSYRARPLNKRRLPRRGARFGAASLSIVPHPQMMGGATGGSSCLTFVQNESNQNFQATEATLRGRRQGWIDLGPQYPHPDPADRGLGSQTDDNTSSWETGGNNPGDACSNTVLWQVVVDGGYFGPGVTISTSRDWGGSINTSCRADPPYGCSGGDDGNQRASWKITGGYPAAGR
jgi:hypothetical protein